MKYQRLGNSGLYVSRICLGAMTFGVSDGFMKGVSLEERESRQLLDRAPELGINFIDTADVYNQGKSEEIVGRWLKEKRRDAWIIATKARMRFGDAPNDTGLSRHHIMNSVDKSLKRLGTDYIDLYQMHMEDPNTPIDETMRALDDLVRSGKVRYIGCSNFRAYRISRAQAQARQHNQAHFTVLQAQYSLLCRTLEWEHVPMCRDEGIGIIAWSPLGRGLLTGRYQRNQKPPEGSRLAVWKETFDKFDTEQTWKIVEMVDRCAKELGCTSSQLALAYLLAQPAVSSVIVGVRTVAQLNDNAGADAVVIPPAMLEKLAAVSRPEPVYPYDFIENISKLDNR